ncbi:Fur family transcriptional regulator [uncultured Bifidobacterium sp.]|uniref:Fur family transcriptional regulator n=1 Tax=uncultured Bifidobacterium sp. TaxID=165187 RepID=UPI00260F30A1|nr:transcriptional repressor [uncultured Bifidobacterium sp.]
MDRPLGGAARRTWQRRAVLEQLRGCDDFVSAQGLHRLLEASGTSIGLSTVYRQLNSLAEAGLADTIRLNERQMFRVCEDGSKHHHHLVCERCGKTFEIEPPDQDWFASVARRHDFIVTSHTMEVFGLCSECQAERTTV